MDRSAFTHTVSREASRGCAKTYRAPHFVSSPVPPPANGSKMNGMQLPSQRIHELAPATVGLRRVKLLGGMSAEALEAFARQCAWRRFKAGEMILVRDTPGRDVYMLVSGRVRVTIYTESGKQVTFRDLGDGDSVGEVAAIDGAPRSADVIALTDVLSAAIPHSQFRDLLAREPTVAERFMAHLANLVRLLSERVVQLSTLGVKNRIHAELLRLARESAQGRDDARAMITPAPRHHDIAARVSTTREQVTRELSALTRSGLLQRARGGLLVTDLELLQQMVERAGDREAAEDRAA